MNHSQHILSLAERLEAYREFEILRTKISRKIVVEEISARYGLSNVTVYDWFRGRAPMGARAGRVARIPELLYVLGALLGDGCIYHWRGNFQVWLVGESKFAAKFAKKLSFCLGRSVHYYKYGTKNAWFVSVGNAELFFLLSDVRKDYSKIGTLVSQCGEGRGWQEFIEGFFGAEGCVKLIREASRLTPKVCLDLCNTDLQLLDLVKLAIAAELGIESSFSSQKGLSGRKTIHHLRIYRKASISKFLEAIRTTKLTEKKRPFVESWLTKRR